MKTIRRRRGVEGTDRKWLFGSKGDAKYCPKAETPDPHSPTRLPIIVSLTAVTFALTPQKVTQVSDPSPPSCQHCHIRFDLEFGTSQRNGDGLEEQPIDGTKQPVDSCQEGTRDI